MQFQFVYINCVSTAEAQKIGRTLVEQKWVASANIFNQTLSYYWWEGELVEDPQATLILQCRTEHLEKLSAKIKSMHSYSLPCIIALPIDEGSADFIDWMQRVLPAELPQEAPDGE
jgi:periplasmic divalent cation tolerance protein